jgi:hypothetical protein
MNEYMKKNFGYEVEGDIDTLREAKKSLEAEQIELKKHSYMNAKYMENMLMIETISSLVKAHDNTSIVKEDDKEVEYGDTEEDLAKALGMTEDELFSLAEDVGIDQYGGLTKDNYEDVMQHIIDNFEDYKQIGESPIIDDSLVKEDSEDSVFSIRAFKNAEDPSKDGLEITKTGGMGGTVIIKNQKELKDLLVALKGNVDNLKENLNEDDEELINKVAEWIYHESSEPISEIEYLLKKSDAVGEYMDAVSESKESVTEDDEEKYDSSDKGRYDGSHPDNDFDDEEKGAEHYRWKNESQLAVALGRIESAMEEIDHAIEYRGDNSAKFFNNGDKAGVGSLMSIKGTLQKVLDNWEKDTEFYGM